MKKYNVKLFIIGLLAAIALAWAVNAYLPSIMEAEKQCASPKVIDDMSRELLICYNEMDRCNKYFKACVDAYLQQGSEEAMP